jgi:hypothetical protein
MHRLVVTITAPNEINESAVLETFASQLEDVAADIVSLAPQDHSFGAFGLDGCKVYYRIEIDDLGSRQTDLPVAAGQ